MVDFFSKEGKEQMENTSLGIAPDQGPKPNRENETFIATGAVAEQVIHPDSEDKTTLSLDEPLEEPEPMLGIQQVLERMDSLSREFQALQQGFDSKIKYDTSKERIIDSLHSELQTYRDGLHFQIMRPLFMDLISLDDDLSNLLKYNNPVDGESENAQKQRKNLTSIRDSLENILEAHGVAVIKEAGDSFVPKRQNVMKTEVTGDLQKDRMICERVRKGFEYEGRVLRTESVVLYKYIENQ
jgi:molecular chaperone GrpE